MTEKETNNKEAKPITIKLGDTKVGDFIDVPATNDRYEMRKTYVAQIDADGTRWLGTTRDSYSSAAVGTWWKEPSAWRGLFGNKAPFNDKRWEYLSPWSLDAYNVDCTLWLRDEASVLRPEVVEPEEKPKEETTTMSKKVKFSELKVGDTVRQPGYAGNAVGTIVGIFPPYDTHPETTYMVGWNDLVSMSGVIRSDIPYWMQHRADYKGIESVPMDKYEYVQTWYDGSTCEFVEGAETVSFKETKVGDTVLVGGYADGRAGTIVGIHKDSAGNDVYLVGWEGEDRSTTHTLAEYQRFVKRFGWTGFDQIAIDPKLRSFQSWGDYGSCTLLP